MRSRESSDWVDCCTAEKIDELCKTNEFSPLIYEIQGLQFSEWLLKLILDE